MLYSPPGHTDQHSFQSEGVNERASRRPRENLSEYPLFLKWSKLQANRPD